MNQRPSDIFGINTTWWAYQFDTAIYLAADQTVDSDFGSAADLLGLAQGIK